VVPIVFAPVSVKAIFGSGIGPWVYESDQSRTDEALDVALLVKSASRVRAGYVVDETPVRNTGNDENPTAFPGRMALGSGVPVVSST